MKSILLTGAYGQLGLSFGKLFHSKYEIYFSGRNYNPKSGIYLDITNSILYHEVLNFVKPDLVINFAALTDVDLCEQKPELAYAINLGGLTNLVEHFNGPIIQISTDYVFDGENGPYEENDITNPINVYGSSKLESERILLENSKDNLVIRTNVLYDYSNNNSASFLNWVVGSLKKENEISIVEDQWNNPTWTSSLAVVIEKAIDKGFSGLIHWGDKDWINRYEFANKIADAFNLKASLIKPVLTSELNQKANRPLKSGFKTEFAQKLLNLEPPTIKECLDSIKKQI
tara:strand:- start:1203 stop:2063 length:861 start_codon:yes stop_codon:yes gene_type:complete